MNIQKKKNVAKVYTIAVNLCIHRLSKSCLQFNAQLSRFKHLILFVS